MAIGDSVSVSISIAQAASPQTESLNTPMIAAYHTHYAARFKEYSGQGGAGLAAMVTDGFKVTDAAYKAALEICSQQPCPANFAIGKRTLAPLQTLTLTLTDGTIGDSYNLTLVSGQDGLSHAITYTIPANFGSAVSGTVSVSNASSAITFSTSQTMAAGDLLVFSAQPGVYYALNASVSGTSGTLTGNFGGPTTAAATSTHLATLAGTANAVNGSATVATSTSQVGAVAVGDSVMFNSQLNVFYTVLTVSASQIVLTTPYNGTTNAATHFADVSTVNAAAAAVETLIAALPNMGTVSVTNNVITIARTDGLLNDVQNWLTNGFSNIQLQDTTVDPGIATDLAAIYAADKLDWYGLVLDSNSEAEIRAAQAWVEATGEGGKFAFYNNSDYQNEVSTVTTDVFSLTQLAGYQKCHIQQNNEQLLCYAGASSASWALVRNPGSYVMAQNMTLPGVLADTDVTLPEAAQLIINAKTANSPTTLGKGGNFYKVTAGLNASFWGLTPKGLFADLIIFIDWLFVNTQADVFAVLAGRPKVPYDKFGAGLIGDAVTHRLQIGASPAFGGIDPDLPIIVNVPNPDTVDQTDRAAGNLPNVTFSATYDNGIVSTTIQGTIVE